MTNTLFTIWPPLLLVTPTSLFALPLAGGLRHAVLLNANNVRPSVHPRCKPTRRFRIFPHLPDFHKTRGSLNFLTVHSRSQNLPLISCMYASNFQRRLTLLCLISVWCKTPSSAFSKKKFSDDPHFCTFSVEPSTTVLCTIENSHRLRDIWLLSIPWPWKPGYGSLKVIENYKTKSRRPAPTTSY